MSLLDLPPLPVTADPVIVPGLLTGLGVTRRPVPAWVTDTGLAESIALGLVDIDDEFTAVDQPTLQQIETRIAARACFYLTVLRAHVDHLERQIAAHLEAP